MSTSSCASAGPTTERPAPSSFPPPEFGIPPELLAVLKRLAISEKKPICEAEYDFLPEARASSASGSLLSPSKPSAEVLKSLAAVPSGMVSASRGSRARGKKGRKETKSERHVEIGNDQRVPWMKRIPMNAVHWVDWRYDIGPATAQAFATTSTVGNTYFSLQIVASAFNDFSSCAAVFDQYCIAECEVHIFPQVTEVTTPTNIGTYVTAVDVDDATVPTVYQDVESYQTAVSSSGTVGHFHRWRPSFAMAVYSGAFTSFAPATGWIDCGSPNVVHYGIKAAFSPTTAVQAFYAIVRCRLGFRNQH